MGPPSDPEKADKKESLERALRDWWEDRNQGWGSDDAVADGGVWDHMPEIDSKEVTRAAPVCEEHLDGDFDPTLVREGGYDSIDDLIDHLVPKLIEQEIQND